MALGEWMAARPSLSAAVAAEAAKRQIDGMSLEDARAMGKKLVDLVTQQKAMLIDAARELAMGAAPPARVTPEMVAAAMRR